MAQSFAIVGRFALVFAVAAAGLRILDAVPRSITGLPRGALRFASLKDLSPAQQRALPVPRALPDLLDWPPGRPVTYPGGSVSAMATHRVHGATWLVLAFETPEDERLRSGVLPDAALLQDAEMMTAGVPVRVQRVQERTGALWHQTMWPYDGGRRILRYRGGLDDLIEATSSLIERNAR